MNEFIGKKLGEVLAFATVAAETWTKGSEAFENAFGEDKLHSAIRENRLHQEKILEIADKAGLSAVVQKKLAGTGEKLRAMRDLYVGDQWDNPTELMEWSGFFEGAAIVHWRLIEGAGEEIDSEEIMGLAEDALALHQALFETAGSYLQEIGQSKAAQE